MGSKLKEDERNERTIRALLKQSENRRCINCGSLGPQYVCTTFSIFVCTNCSGLHREFTHRIKSVSMAKFTAEEVRNLQAGGNERGREIFLKEYDQQRNPLPDSSNVDSLRDFIKNVYVERRHTGDRLPPRDREGDQDDSNDSRRPEHRSESRSDARSPSFEDRHDERRFVEKRRCDVDRGRIDDRIVRFEEKINQGRFEPGRGRFEQKSQYDDRRQEDNNRIDERERGLRASSDDRFANEIRNGQRKSADDRPDVKDLDGDNPPVRPLTEILGDNVPALWVEEYRHSDCHDKDDRLSHGSAAEQQTDLRTWRLGSSDTINGSASVAMSAVIERVNSDSLIDFSAEPDSLFATIPAAGPLDISTMVVPQSPTVSSSSKGWATFDTAPTAIATVPPPEGPPAGYPDVFMALSNGHQWAAGGWPSIQTPCSSATESWSSLVGSSVQQSVMAAGSQAWKSFPTLGSEPATHSILLQLQPDLLHEQQKSSCGLSTIPSVDRSRELPKELFANSFPITGMPTGGVATGQQIPGFALATQPFGIGALPTYPLPPRSRNPFDLPGDVAASTGMGDFPSLGPIQAALPNGLLSLPVSVTPTSSNQWSMGLQPASYPPSSPAGGSGSGSVFVAQLSITPSSLTQGEATGPMLGYSESVSFNSRELSLVDPTFTGSGTAAYPHQNFQRTISGNPFG